MSDSDIILLSVLVPLVGYLYWKYRQRVRSYPQERQWPGHGLDATRIADRVHRVRSDYVAELHSRPATCRRAGLLASARSAVGRLPYFRRRASQSAGATEHERENHA